MHRISKKIYDYLNEHDGFIIVPHQHPDGDALGSATALGGYLESMGKSWRIFCATPAGKNMAFLPWSDRVETDPAIWDEPTVSTVIFVDSGDPVYAGAAEYLEKMKDTPYIINIDHHATNIQYGDLNLVIPDASSTTEVLYHFFTHHRVVIDGRMATSLLTGLITDTGNFSNRGTSRYALIAGSELIKRGARLHQILESVLKNKTVNTLKFWGIMLSRLAIHETHNIAYTYYTLGDIEVCGVTEEESEGIANLLNFLNEGKAALVAKEREDGTVKVSLRTTKDDVDVSAIARFFGGGGHVKAAGFTVEGPAERALEHIFSTLQNASDKKMIHDT